jgi:hypothetical protein
MIINRALIGALLIGILAFAPSACGITISVGSNAGGFSESINADEKDAVYSSTVIAANSLSHSIEGSGSLKESHSVSNTAGANAGVGVDIRQAEWYSYSYNLWPGHGSSWPASKFAQVAASEQLDVFNAKYIQAYANAHNSKGYTAGVSTVVSDPGREASLTGYRNLAMASKNEAFASQTADGAFSPHGFIQADSGADFAQLKSRPLQFRWDKADASIRVDSGSVEGYSDLASASAYGVTASQQINAATGGQIRTRSESASWTASLFQGLKKTDAKVSTRAEGTLTGYNASTGSSEGYAESDQAGHIVGTFTSTALAGKAIKTRTSNYGEEYDFDMQARKDASGSYATGTLDYYVDNASPVANRIQGAVDASESGDAINVAVGTYNENVLIDKSLKIKGAGASDTMVDGQQSGSVFTIGSQNDADMNVALSGMTIQNGSGTETDVSEIYRYSYGGGILNYGRLTVIDSSIKANNAAIGGGIYNNGTMNLIGCSASDNIAMESDIELPHRSGGGIYNSRHGTMNLEGCSIFNNIARGSEDDGSGDGGGILNNGLMNLNDTSVSDNIAEGSFSAGGGISNRGLLNLNDVSVSDNIAAGSRFALGGGIYNGFYGISNLNGCTISGNMANASISADDYNGGYGGGIYNGYNSTMNLKDSSISDNSARASGDHAAYAYGGGIYNDDYGTLKLENISISNNIVEYTATEEWGDGGMASGGGIYGGDYGTLNLEDCSISNNTAKGLDYGSGGGIHNGDHGILNLKSCEIFGNNAWGFTMGSAGGIYSRGVINLESSSVSNNTAAGYSMGYSGGIANGGRLNLTNSTISGNTAKANFNANGGGVYNMGTLSLEASSISNNTATASLQGSGGGVYNEGTLNLDRSSISGNRAVGSCSGFEDCDGYGSGGGIYNWRYGTLNLESSSVSDNTAIGSGTGGYGTGGGIFNEGMFRIDNVTPSKGSSISYNTADNGAAIYSRGTLDLWGGSIDHNNAINGSITNEGVMNIYGGSINHNRADYEGGGIRNLGELNLYGGNISNNIAGHIGGGIYSDSFSTVNMEGGSISYNQASSGGGIYNDYSGTVNLNRGSIDHNNATSPAPSGGGIYSLGTITGDTSIVHDNTPDQIVYGVDWLPEI